MEILPRHYTHRNRLLLAFLKIFIDPLANLGSISQLSLCFKI